MAEQRKRAEPVIVYRLDRISRSILDFAGMMEEICVFWRI